MILFDKKPQANVLRMAYNNNTVEFYSNSDATPLNAVVRIGSNPPMIIYPDPRGVFYYNFKSWITSILNSDNFKDNLEFTDGPYDYDWTKIYNADQITIEVNLSDNTVDTETLSLKWLAGYFQKLTPFGRKPILGLALLQQTYEEKAYVKAWTGYPIDLTIYNPMFASEDYTGEIKIFTKDVGEPAYVPFGYVLGRLLLSTGEVSILNSEYTPFPMYAGLQRKTFDDQVEYGFVLDLDVIDPCEKSDYLEQSPYVYVKWLNSFGGWNYWLFDNVDIVRVTKELGEIDNDTKDLAETVSPTIQIGKTSVDRLNVSTDVIDRRDLTLLNDLLESEKVFIYTAPRFSAYSPNSWLQVSLNTSSVNIQKAKRKQNRFDLIIETPQRENRTI